MTSAKQTTQRINPSDVTVVIMGGGRGTRLYPLTKNRAKPAVSFGAKYRLIDITMANCFRSELEKIFILTQFNSFSLNRHIWRTYSHEISREGFIEVIAAEQTIESGDWFQGTADAVRQSLRYVLRNNPKYVLILSADQIYGMDYQAMLQWHVERQADVTIAARLTAPPDIAGLGVVQVDDAMQVRGFYEKPENAGVVSDFKLTQTASIMFPPQTPFLCSMGLYLFNTETLLAALDNEEQDFGKAVIPMAAKKNKMLCYPFEGYWEDVGTIQAFFDANMEWREGKGVARSFQEGNAIITHARQLPPTFLEQTVVRNSLIADGCYINAERIERSIIGVRSRIGAGTAVEESIVMGNNNYRKPNEFEIAENCTIRRAIIDKDVVIGAGSKITNAQGIVEETNDLYSIRSGIIVIPMGTVIPPGSCI